MLGAITYVSATGGPTYTEEDLTFAEDLAGRCAIAIDNARLYRHAEQARAQAEIAHLDAQTASRAKSQFLAMVSHEIRTPINAIVGYTELLLMGLDGSLTHAQREKLERIQASSQHLLGLVNHVLDFAKVEARQMTVQREKARVAEVVEGAVQIDFPQALDHALDVKNACADEGLSYYGDPDRVRQVLVNLLTNATKFTPPGGRITIRCGLAGQARRRRDSPGTAPGSTWRWRTPGSESPTTSCRPCSSRSCSSAPGSPAAREERAWAWRSAGSWPG